MVMRVQKSDPRGNAFSARQSRGQKVCGLILRATFRTTPLMMISINKEQDKGKL